MVLSRCILLWSLEQIFVVQYTGLVKNNGLKLWQCSVYAILRSIRLEYKTATSKGFLPLNLFHMILFMLLFSILPTAVSRDFQLLIFICKGLGSQVMHSWFFCFLSFLFSILQDYSPQLHLFFSNRNIFFICNKKKCQNHSSYNLLNELPVTFDCK